MYKLVLREKAQYLYIELASFDIITKATQLGLLYDIMSTMFGFRVSSHRVFYYEKDR